MGNLRSDNGVCALLLGEFERDRLLLKEIFRRAGWRLLEARNRRRALDCLKENPVQVVITESELPDWNWKHVLRDLRRMTTTPPQLVVTSRTADEHLWAEVLNVGGYDVLAQPFEADEVERVVASAYRHFAQPIGAGLGRVVYDVA